MTIVGTCVACGQPVDDGEAIRQGGRLRHEICPPPGTAGHATVPTASNAAAPVASVTITRIQVPFGDVLTLVWYWACASVMIGALLGIAYYAISSALSSH